MGEPMNAGWPEPPAQLQPLIQGLKSVTRTDENQWEASCPNPDHLDSTPSFGFRAGDSKPIVGSCHRGCTWSEIQAGLGQLGVDAQTVESANPSGVAPKAHKAVSVDVLSSIVRFRDGVTSDRALDAIEFLTEEAGLTVETIADHGLGFRPKTGRIAIPVPIDGVIVNIRDYLPHAGETDDKTKSIPGHGQSVLYPAWHLEGNDLPVILAEGEKDALKTHQEGQECEVSTRDGDVFKPAVFVAVTGTGGALNPPKDLSRLAGREVFIAYDADSGGVKGAKNLLEKLAKAGARAYVLDVTRLGLTYTETKGEDLTDFFMRHHGTAERIVQEMDVLRKAASPKQRGLILRRASEIQSRRQRFLWENRMPMGTISLFAGSGGVGKSTFALWLAVELQHGRLPGDLYGEQATILYISVEDDWETVMKPRLQAAGADMDRIYSVSISSGVDAETGERYPLLPEDLDLVRKAVVETNASMVIFDPITSTISGDDHKRGDVRAVLDPLAQMAGELDVAVVGIMHFKKGAGDVSDKVSGSHAFRDTARALMLFAKDNESGEVVMSQDKGNYADYGDASLAYRLVDTVVELDDGDVAHVARVEMLGVSGTNVSEIVNRVPASEGAALWLSSFMAANNGRVSAKEALEAAKEAGFSTTAINRTKLRARPPVESVKSGMDGGWDWVCEEIVKKSAGTRIGVFSVSGASGRFLQDDPAEETATPGAEETEAPEETALLLTRSRRNRIRSSRGSSAVSS